jgi:hypothetical protein
VNHWIAGAMLSAASLGAQRDGFAQAPAPHCGEQTAELVRTLAASGPSLPVALAGVDPIGESATPHGYLYGPRQLAIQAERSRQVSGGHLSVAEICRLVGSQFVVIAMTGGAVIAPVGAITLEAEGVEVSSDFAPLFFGTSRRRALWIKPPSEIPAMSFPTATTTVAAFRQEDLLEGGFVVWHRTWRKADGLPIRQIVWARLPASWSNGF